MDQPPESESPGIRPKRAPKPTEKARLLAASSSSKVPDQTPEKAPKRSRKRTQESSGSSEADSDSNTPARKRAPAPAQKKKKRRVAAAASIEVLDDADEPDPDVETIDVDDGETEGNEVQEVIALSSDDDELVRPTKHKLKADSTRDLELVFSHRVTVVFKSNKGSQTEERGRWCTICRASADVKLKKGPRAGFYKGSNSTCRRHIRNEHYAQYSKLCKEKGIEESNEAIPKEVLQARKAKAEDNKTPKQTTLDGVVTKVVTPTAFSKTAILDAVTQHVVCNDEALLLADKPTFNNCLVTMRWKTIREELPTPWTVKMNINNHYVTFLDTLCTDIAAAPGAVSVNWDLWTRDVTSEAEFGMTGQWVDMKPDRWTLRAEVIAFHVIIGEHSGENLGRYFIKFTDRAGITSKSSSKLGWCTADNASNNDTTVVTVASLLSKRKLPATGISWDAKDRRLSCLGHVINLAVEDFMKAVTQVAVVETRQAIWDYDPSLSENAVRWGTESGLDVIAVIRTLAVKIQASPQRKQAFEEQQRLCGIAIPLVIPLHTNTRWGSAGKMLDRAYLLRNAIKMFTTTADEKFGPITVIRQQGRVTKKIPWLAFQIQDADWKRAKRCAEVLADANRYQQAFSAHKVPTLHRAIPIIETLCSRWEKKVTDAAYKIYHPAIKSGLEKLGKYYELMDNSSVYVLAIFLHPYYKLSYFELKWGGQQEQEEEIAAGNTSAINWQEYARETVEKAVENYWPLRFGANPHATSASEPAASSSHDDGNTSADDANPAASAKSLSDDDEDDEYDRLRRERFGSNSGGWRAELKRYLDDPSSDVVKDTDTLDYWRKHADIYPTLARMVVDILSIPASSVACERLFSRAKLVSVDRRARLGGDLFEAIECLNFYWRDSIVDLARLNSGQTEEIEVDEDLRQYASIEEHDSLYTNE